ncbi:MAG: hypothetical protein J6J18_01875 [Oscillospiraceae bacterium]|nr:hypothetical protein [Oscillospiraceae bacterium]
MDKRWITEKEGMAYTGMGKTKFREWARSIGAATKIGAGKSGAVRYDLKTIDAALEEGRKATHGTAGA